MYLLNCSQHHVQVLLLLLILHSEQSFPTVPSWAVQYKFFFGDKLNKVQMTFLKINIAHNTLLIV
jgi:hypothetical protein